MRIVLSFVLGVTAFPALAEDLSLVGESKFGRLSINMTTMTHGHLLVPQARFAASAKDAFGRGVGYKFQIDFGKGRRASKTFTSMYLSLIARGKALARPR